jgi:hypothetical protein
MNEKDLILNTMISETEINPYFSYSSLKDSLFPDLHFDQVKFIVESIKKEKTELLTIIEYSYEGGTLIQPTGLVSDFLKNGGFTKIEKEREIERIKKLKREEKEDKLLDLDLRLRKFESKIGKKLIIFAAIISFLSFLVTVLTLEFWQTGENKSEQKNQVENPLLNKKEGIQKDSLN